MNCNIFGLRLILSNSSLTSSFVYAQAANIVNDTAGLYQIPAISIGFQLYKSVSMICL